MLRDLLCSMPGFATWPCDEINYIWRHGNIAFPSDAFTPDMATPQISAYIRRRFAWVHRHYRAHTVVEKTCANSLRVGFVERVLERPKYIFIHRDGIDAAASAMSRWKAALDFPYLLRKARFVPPSDLPYYATRYIGNRLARLRSREGRLATWGPVLPGMDRLIRQHELPVLCAIQWRACVDAALDAFDAIDDKRTCTVAYEELVGDKRPTLACLAQFLEIDEKQLQRSPLVSRMNAQSVGKGRKRLSADALAAMSEIIQPTMRRLDRR